jgi:hypothetical protein
MNKRFLLSSLVLACGVALPTSTAEAQSAEDILNESLERYRASTEGIDRYTVVQDVMGFESTITLEKQVVDGYTILVPAGEGAPSSMSSFQRMYPELASRARLEGEDEVDGETVYALHIDDFSGVDFGPVGAGAGDFNPRDGTFFIGTDTYLLRKMEMEGEVTTEEGTNPFAFEVLMQDYREVEGMWHPFLVTVTGAAAGVSEDDLREARKALSEMEEQLERMPEAQRAMAEQMMKGHMERLDTILESGAFEMTITTKELLINP